jgi:hypothetical protein
MLNFALTAVNVEQRFEWLFASFAITAVVFAGIFTGRECQCSTVFGLHDHISHFQIPRLGYEGDGTEFDRDGRKRRIRWRAELGST